MRFIELHSDVLAVKCVRDHIFFGVGCTLYMANYVNRKILTKKSILHPENIHNILEKSNQELLVYGGKSLAVVCYNNQDDMSTLEVRDIHRFYDWIINVKCIKYSGMEVVAILFAHNNVHIYDLDQKVLTNVACKETCLLYAGLIAGDTHETAAILGGTVFQEILIWKLKTDTEYSEVLHRLKGHKGVIFSIYFCPVNYTICSTSDDRTVRLWSVSSNSTSCDNMDWRSARICLQTTMYGHLARVWKAIIFKQVVLSVGEDSRICMWSLCGNLLNKIDAHKGAAIWSIDVSENEVIFTGGADGSVNSWPLYRPDARVNLRKNVLLDGSKGFSPKYVKLLDSNDLLVFSNDKSVSKLVFMKKTGHQPGTSYDLPNVSNYCILEICPSKSRLALASISGQISIYEKHEETWNLSKTYQVAASKIFSLQWLTDETSIVCADGGSLFLVEFSKDEMKIRSQHTLPPSRERWTTSACSCQDLIICGDRMGSIFVYKAHSHIEEPIQTFKKIHGRLGVQSCIIFNSKLVTTGRDGTLKCFEFCDLTKKNSSVKFLHSKSMPMDWVGRLLPHENDLYVLGFKEENFVVYSLSLKRLLLKISCGGGHRSWDCLISNNSMNFVFIQRKSVFSVEASLKELFLPPVFRGFHTKVIYCAQVLIRDFEDKILLSGGEDCTLNISLVKCCKSKSDQVMRNLASFDGHLSNIKSLSILEYPQNGKAGRNFIFSCGGRAQMKIWEVDLGSTKHGIFEEDIKCIDLLSYMLHGPDKERSKIWSGKELMYNADPETRFMDISTMIDPVNSNFILVFVACSDGYMRIFRYDVASNEIRLATSVPYKNRCILKIHSFIYHEKIVCMTMATDGYLSFWSVHVKNEAVYVDSILVHQEEGFLLHQSGINSFALKVLNSKQYLLATGGDDNLLSMLLFEIMVNVDEKFSIKVVSSWKTTEAHHAQISGVALLDNKLFSVGADQKLVIHEYTLESSKIKCIHLKQEVLCISDIQGLTVLESSESNNELFCVFGKGLQIFKNQTHLT